MSHYLVAYLAFHILSGFYFAEHAYRYFRDEFPTLLPFSRPNFYVLGLIGGPITALANCFTFNSITNPHEKKVGF
jgi:hypothetical protein